MRGIAEFPEAVRRGIRFVLADIDDTLTSGGRLTAAAYGALERLQERGYPIIPVTGRVVRSDCPPLARGCGGRRERRLLFQL